MSNLTEMRGKLERILQWIWLLFVIIAKWDLFMITEDNLLKYFNLSYSLQFILFSVKFSQYSNLKILLVPLVQFFACTKIISNARFTVSSMIRIANFTRFLLVGVIQSRGKDNKARHGLFAMNVLGALRCIFVHSNIFNLI